QPKLGQRDGTATNANAAPVESFPWVGPKTVVLHKNTQGGYGFTLRHFIVYPPESATPSVPFLSFFHCDTAPSRNRLEPMDTIFVKSVKEDGPAHQAGLRTGDRLVKVNGESIIGKTYSQVIGLIQNCEDALELSIMPKDEDILQLAYSQDAYLKGNEPYSGGAQSIPEPPPICYPRKTYPFQSRPSPRDVSAAETSHSSPAHRTEEVQYGVTHRVPVPRPLPVSEGRPSRDCVTAGPKSVSRLECQQALSNWISSQVPRRSSSEERHCAMPPRYRSVSQDHLGDAPAPRGWPHSASQDTLIQSPAHEGWSYRARSDNYLVKYGRSLEALEQGALVSPRYERCMCSYIPSASSRDPPPVHVQKHPSQPNLQSIDDSGYIGYRSYSPSFQRRTGLLHALSFRDAAFGDLPTFNLSQRQANNSTPPYIERPLSTAVLPNAEDKRDEVVLRQKPPTGRKMPPPTRQMNFVFPDNMKETDICDPPPPVLAAGKENKQGVAPLATPEDSLASIPFIDEPTSPSIDLKAKHIPASSVVSSAMNSAPVLSASPSSPTFTFAINRHYSQDCSNIKASRRSSYLLAITTERSKSCDDGLNTFRDEGKLLRRLPSRVPSLRMLRSFFTDGSLDSLGTSEDTRSKRHSTSDLSDVTFSDVRKEGWLHYKQILTKKGKKVGGGIRQWKRAFAVLRAHLLYLCKDRREAVALAPPPGEEEQPPISIRACLVDISYSDTKRKHVFRLTTADFCECLFQAEDRDDMLAWIKAIRESSKAEGEDPGFARFFLLYIRPELNLVPPWIINLYLGYVPHYKNDSLPQKAPWGINIMKKNKKPPPRAFGVRLEDCQPAPDNKKIPLIVEACCKVVEDKGLEYMGIYRVPGNNAVVSSLQEHLNKGSTEINLQDERWQDLNVISSLLKSFFRKLPEPLFTDDKYNDFIEANRIEDPSERMKTLRKLIRDLPGHYYETLKFLVGHLKTIADHSEKNKMEPRNLALVFGPTLVRTSEDNMTDMVTHMPDRYKIVETLIQHSDWFFSDKEDKGEKTPVDDQESQSVPNIEYLLPNIGRTTALGDTSDSTNSGSAKSKASWGSRKEHYHKEMLAISFISAVNRKRKKRREAKRFGSSTDDDSEHESAAKRDEEYPVKLEAELEENKAATSRGSPELAQDARSIVSGYSTLSTIDRSLCSEVQSVAESRGEEADDERSEFSHVETDTENGFVPGQAGTAVVGEGGATASDKASHSRASFSSHRLMQCDSLARRKLSRPRRNSEAASSKSSTEVPSSSSPGSQESLQPTEAPTRPSLTEQLRLRLRGSADDMLAVRLRKPHSPETRRKKNSWRRHTVVVPGGLKDLNYNEWKEQNALGATEACPLDSSSRDPLRDNKDSGLSSLESTKARPSLSMLGSVATPGQQGSGEHQQHKGSSEGRSAPRRAASLRFHQCL
uniref:Rho GTPase activating protein 23 n=1 Tax=Varanus komodoensis TaxID=61221 RepID=A0A8D2J1J1_VARKO